MTGWLCSNRRIFRYLYCLTQVKYGTVEITCDTGAAVGGTRVVMMDREAVIGGIKGRILFFCTPLVFAVRACSSTLPCIMFDCSAGWIDGWGKPLEGREGRRKCEEYHM